MRRIFLFILTLVIFAGCKKDGAAKVEIYLLKSFTTEIIPDNPARTNITNAVLENVPMVNNTDIQYYDQQSALFKLHRDIRPEILNYGPDKAFAVTVNGQHVYYGRFHPAYMSSITIGVATIDPILMNNNELFIKFETIQGNPVLQQLDYRNDLRILNALQATGRLR